MNDIRTCNKELIIESPFITKRRVALLLPKLRKLTARGVKITVNTRDPQQHEEFMQHEAEEGTALLQSIGVNVLFTGGHHRKLVILDRRVFYEGSLNVLSQWDSCEFMRRIECRGDLRLSFQQLQTVLLQYLQADLAEYGVPYR
jgi:phosphatidylserine/phosphatidylglycerophosphate/cardiolipin synthase-like enzyme